MNRREPAALAGKVPPAMAATSFETALGQWREGERRMAGAPPQQRRALELVVNRIEAELRRRLGGTFTTDELAELYEQGTDWCTDLASSVAPDAPWAWDARTVADTAFLRYLRDARDFAGGRRTEA